MNKQTLNIDLNRVEGDLEFELDVEDDIIVDARCKGVMYRGFEQLLIDRAARDAVVLTPRICGICGTAHMYCAVLALESIWQVRLPANATRIRNMCLMAENVQSDLRQSFLMFTPDFCNEKYQQHPMFPQMLAAFEPFKGKVHRSILEQTKKILEIVAIWGGQWPHSSYMVPGGVTLGPSMRRIIDSSEIVEKQIQYFESDLVGCSLDKWQGITTAAELFDWLDESPDHANSAIGLFIRFSRDIGLHEVGTGSENMICYGGYHDPDSWQVPFEKAEHLLPAGYFDADLQQVLPFEQSYITEHVKYSWFRNYDGGKHPYDGETVPAYLPKTEKYTWAKAPRYNNKVVQTGPLAEFMVAQQPLITDLYQAEGGNTWLRQFARLRRVSETFLSLRAVLKALQVNVNEPYITPAAEIKEKDGEGFGMVQAARGSLGHWVKIKDGRIDKYQIVTPTAWNASPKDTDGHHGHWEQSVIGMKIDDVDNPVTIGHVVRSHDPCLVCTVHMVGADATKKTMRYGV